MTRKQVLKRIKARGGFGISRGAEGSKNQRCKTISNRIFTTIPQRIRSGGDAVFFLFWEGRGYGAGPGAQGFDKTNKILRSGTSNDGSSGG